MDFASGLPTLHRFITSGGTIDVGRLEQFECVAVASDSDTLWAALSRQPGEGLNELLKRLDNTLDRCLALNMQVNEMVFDA